MKKTKLYRVSFLTTILMLLSSWLLIGCSSNATNKEAISEKQVLETTYASLMNKAGQLQGTSATIEQGIIDWGFQSSMLSAGRDDVQSDSGGGPSVTIKFPERYVPPVTMPEFTIAMSVRELKTFVKSHGDGTWSITVSTYKWEFEFSERTGDVRATNDEAARLLDDITLRTYYNDKYGYSIRYPPKWNVLDGNKDGVNIASLAPDGSMIASIFIVVSPKKADLVLRDYAENTVKYAYPSDRYDIGLAEGNPGVGGVVARIVGLRLDQKRNIGYEARWYFIGGTANLYQIIASAKPASSGSFLFDPYQSLRFQPQ